MSLSCIAFRTFRGISESGFADSGVYSGDQGHHGDASQHVWSFGRYHTLAGLRRE